MKITFCIVLLLAFTACSSEEATRDAPAPPADAGAPKRRLVDSHVLPTSPVNLLVDPAFASNDNGGTNYGAFLGLENPETTMPISTTRDSRAPSGFAGSVAILRWKDDTDAESIPMMMLASFHGGRGPFSAQVWVSKSNVAGDPVEIELDKGDVTAAIATDFPEGKSFDLSPVPEAKHVSGGRTWCLLRTRMETPLPREGYFIVKSGGHGGQILVAAPEVTSDEVVVGQRTQSLSTAFVAARSLGDVERRAMTTYRLRMHREGRRPDPPRTAPRLKR